MTVNLHFMMRAKALVTFWIRGNIPESPAWERRACLHHCCAW
jgi:hypothetical protein